MMAETTNLKRWNGNTYWITSPRMAIMYRQKSRKASLDRYC